MDGVTTIFLGELNDNSYNWKRQHPRANHVKIPRGPFDYCNRRGWEKARIIRPGDVDGPDSISVI